MQQVSVIIPVYNVEQYLDECLESVVNQTYKNLQIILVDDGSTDNSPQKCDIWEKRDSRIHVIHKENGGLSDARNVGIAKAKGDFIATIDSDDIIEPTFIEYLYLAITQTNADISQCSYNRFSGSLPKTNQFEKMSEFGFQTQEEALQILTTRSTERINCTVWNKLFRREIVEGVLFPIGYYAQDFFFMSHVFTKCKKIVLIENELYHWRYRSGSATTKFPIHTLHVMEMYFQSSEFLKDLYPQMSKNCKVMICSRCLWLCNELNHYNNDDLRTETLEKCISMRKKTKFTLKEWMSSSLKDKVKITLSSPKLISVCTPLYIFLHGIKSRLTTEV